MKTTTYRFTNDKVQGTQDVTAIDGFNALKTFRNTDLYKECPIHQQKGYGYSGWSMGIV